MKLRKSIPLELTPQAARFCCVQAKTRALAAAGARLHQVINEAISQTGGLPIFSPDSTMKYLLLDEHQQPRACSLQEWAEWQRQDPDLGVDYTVVGNAAIGTRFISVLSHEGAPCWETSVVGGVHHGLREVCGGNRDQAEQMHRRVVERVSDMTGRPG